MEHQAATVPTLHSAATLSTAKTKDPCVPFIGTSTGCPFRSMQTKIQTLQVGPRNMVDDLMGLQNGITTSLQINCEDILCEILGPCTTLDQQLKQALVVTVVGGTNEHASWRLLTSHSCSCLFFAGASLTVCPKTKEILASQETKET